MTKNNLGKSLELQTTHSEQYFLKPGNKKVCPQQIWFLDTCNGLAEQHYHIRLTIDLAQLINPRHMDPENPSN